MFLDECGFSNQPVVRRSWSRCGKTPLIKSFPSRRRLHAIGSICLLGNGKIREHFQVQGRSINDMDLLWFLHHLHRTYRQQLLVIWDNWSVHKKLETAIQELELSWVQFERLPPYAPELNPVEHLWSQTKYHDMANYVPPADTEQWHARVEQSLRKTNRRKKLLKSFFKGCDLDIQEFD